MNWLAHLHLSEASSTFRLGNILPDLAPARELTQLSEEYQRGMECHRRIDAFTDSHPCFRQSVARLTPEFRRYGGIIVDVFYDHFLSVGWSQHSHETLRQCVDEFYNSFDAHRADLPAAVWPILERMREQDWLGSYGDLPGVRLTLWRISRRLRRPRDLGESAAALEQHYDEFQKDFASFYPELCKCVRTSELLDGRPCDQCGRFDAIQLDDRWLCPDCYAACGSCCAGEFLEISPEKPGKKLPKTDIDRTG